MNTYYKYPRTPHLPWSPGFCEDDIRHQNVSNFAGMEVVVTEKMDGENTSLYCDHMHARSLDSRHHPSRDWLKNWHGAIAHTIPEGWRVCGENVFARHSVAYQSLASYFYGFSIWNANNICLGWEETLEWFEILEIQPVPVIFQGLWDEDSIRQLTIETDKQEGYVVRTMYSFTFEDFQKNVAKWVRANHVNTNEHWMHSEIVPNKLRIQDDESS